MARRIPLDIESCPLTILACLSLTHITSTRPGFDLRRIRALQFTALRESCPILRAETHVSQRLTVLLRTS
jgi:hypothetical protein